MERLSVSDAVTRIAEIHGHIAKGEVYRGWRATPVALSGIIGLAAAVFQRRSLAVQDPVAFVIYWSAVAAAAGAVGTSEILHAMLRRPTSFERRQTGRVAIQLLPPMAMAALVTVALIRIDAALVVLLPGLWALLYGLAIFAARPYLPRASGLVALYYAMCGTIVLWGAHTSIARSPWAVGGVFGVGQLFAAAVIYWNLEREEA